MQDNPHQSGERLLRLPEVTARTGLGKSAIYAGILAGTFPVGVKLSRRATAWPSSEIDAWIAERIRRAGRKG
ncbi:MAG: AlpA family phage regulatory protein [Rubrivivax sp.]|nr:AlpA family phage regulatory protein [Pseudomonadota bacterium]